MKLFLCAQASFKLSWCCNGENSDQHKHEIVSFEKGNITTLERSSKQVRILFFTMNSLSFLYVHMISLCLAALSLDFFQIKLLTAICIVV